MFHEAYVQSRDERFANSKTCAEGPICQGVAIPRSIRAIFHELGYLRSTFRAMSNIKHSESKAKFAPKMLGYSKERSGTSRLHKDFCFTKHESGPAWSIAPTSGPRFLNTNYFYLTQYREVVQIVGNSVRTDHFAPQGQNSN